MKLQQTGGETEVLNRSLVNHLPSLAGDNKLLNRIFFCYLINLLMHDLYKVKRLTFWIDQG